MKHIVIIGKYYPPEWGGVERYVYDVARFAAKTYRVTVLVHNKRNEDCIENHHNLKIIRCGTSTIVSGQPISRSMLMHLRALKPDLVHLNAPNFWAAAMLMIARYRGPLIITHHADVFGRPFIKRFVLPIYHHLVGRADCVVVNSTKNALCSTDLPRRAGPFVTIPHGLNEKIYQLDFPTKEDVARERVRLAGHAPLVGFLGRFVRYKGLSVIVDALAQLPGVHALMIGDGPLREQTVQRAKAAGIADRMHFLGSLDEQEKVRRLAMIDVLLLPSTDTTEAFGVVQIEAQLLGKPVIASRLPTGITDVTIDNETGLLIPPGDPDSLGRAITKLIADPDLRARFGENGRIHALKYFTLDVFNRRFGELFDTVLSGKPVMTSEDIGRLNIASTSSGR